MSVNPLMAGVLFAEHEQKRVRGSTTATCSIANEQSPGCELVGLCNFNAMRLYNDADEFSRYSSTNHCTE